MLNYCPKEVSQIAVSATLNPGSEYAVFTSPDLRAKIADEFRSALESSLAKGMHLNRYRIWLQNGSHIWIDCIGSMNLCGSHYQGCWVCYTEKFEQAYQSQVYQSSQLESFIGAVADQLTWFKDLSIDPFILVTKVEEPC